MHTKFVQRNRFGNVKLTPWSWTLLEMTPVLQLHKNFPAFYGIRRFITVFTIAFYWSLSWARSIQFIPPHPISLRSILILCTYLRLGLPSGLLPSGFPTNILYAFLRATCPAHRMKILNTLSKLEQKSQQLAHHSRFLTPTKPFIQSVTYLFSLSVGQ
jgi:hypothetical protein